jgi:hypothetical protein
MGIVNKSWDIMGFKIPQSGKKTLHRAKRDDIFKGNFMVVF